MLHPAPLDVGAAVVCAALSQPNPMLASLLLPRLIRWVFRYISNGGITTDYFYLLSVRIAPTLCTNGAGTLVPH